MLVNRNTSVSSNPLNIATFDFSNVLVNAAINVKIKTFFIASSCKLMSLTNVTNHVVKWLSIFILTNS